MIPDENIREKIEREADPGIRDVLRALWAAGYWTTDSGDGVSKDGDCLPFEHVSVSFKGRSNDDPDLALKVISSLRPGEVWARSVETWRVCKDGETITTEHPRDTLQVYWKLHPNRIEGFHDP